jgi:F0F1-type ATP synthase assembly protein I
VGDRADEALNAIARSKEEGARETAERAQELYERAFRLTWLLLVGGLVVGALFGC